jgi:toxin ParE1/3/4
LRLLFTEPAARDLDSIVSYIGFDNPRAAETVYRAIVLSAERLKDFPSLARTGRLPGTRELVVPSLPYVIVYSADADVITVIAVIHTARDLNAAMMSRKTDPRM